MLESADESRCKEKESSSTEAQWRMERGGDCASQDFARSVNSCSASHSVNAFLTAHLKIIFYLITIPVLTINVFCQKAEVDYSACRLMINFINYLKNDDNKEILSAQLDSILPTRPYMICSLLLKRPPYIFNARIFFANFSCRVFALTAFSYSLCLLKLPH